MALRTEYKYYTVDGNPVREQRKYNAEGKLILELTTSLSRDSRRITISKSQYEQLIEANQQKFEQFQE